MAKRPKILFFDIETKPIRAWIWRTGYKMSVGHDQIVAGDKFDIICIAYKWDGQAEIHSLDWGLHAQDSTHMIEVFTGILEQADLAIAHNGDSFDTKQINTQRLLHGQAPIAWPTSEDTLKQFRKYFAFPSFKLDYLAKILTGSGKDRMQFQDWIDIVEDKDQDALDKMIRYCKRDVLKLSQIFNRAKPFFAPKIHAGKVLHKNADTVRRSCPRCGDLHILSKGFCRLATGVYQRYSCRKCWHVFRGRTLV